MRNFTYVHLSWWLETFNIEYLQWAYLLVGKPPRTAFVSLFSWARFPERTFLIFGLAAKILGEGRDKEGKNLRGAHCSRCRCSRKSWYLTLWLIPTFPCTVSSGLEALSLHFRAHEAPRKGGSNSWLWGVSMDTSGSHYFIYRLSTHPHF